MLLSSPHTQRVTNAQEDRKVLQMGILYWLIIGAIAGWLAGTFTKGAGFGAIGNIIVGIVGAVVGGFVFGLLQLKAAGTVGEIITSTIGAVLFLFVLGKIKK